MPRVAIAPCLLFVALASVAVGAVTARSWRGWSESISREVTDLRFKRGDDPSWGARALEVSDWQPISIFDLPSRDGIYWIRWRVTVREGELLRPRDGVLLSVVASYDLYWDGRLIGHSGKVGVNAVEEEPGQIDTLFQIPGELLGPGEHVLAMRMSSFHTGFPRDTFMLVFQWGYFRSMIVDGVRTASFSVMAVGAALVTAVVFGMMWLLASRRLSFLLFSLLAVCVALMQGLQAWRWLYDYPYSWHHPRLAIGWLFTAMAVLLPAFVMHQFRVGNRWVLGLLAVFVAMSWTFLRGNYTSLSLNLCGIGLVTSLGLTAWASWLRRRGAIFACVGLAMSFSAALWFSNEFLDHSFFISAGPAAICLLVALVLQLRDERREARQAQLTAARLEIELLKKNIQPHFVLNTLATIMEVIEQEPRTAIALIEALASEYRILNRVSGVRLIALEQELELCRAHLNVMGLRKGARCAFHVRGVDERALIPPALFLTLIENGLTHLLPRDGRIEFTLRAEYRGNVARYVLLAEGVRQAPVGRSGGDGLSEPSAAEGTGLRYIKARLEESFTGQWSIESRPVADGWETVIEIAGAGASTAASSHARGAPALPRAAEKAV